MDSHKSSTKTSFFSLHQRLAFPCVWATVIHGTGVASPTPCKTTSSGGDEERTPQEKNGKAVTRQPTRKASLGWKKWEDAASIMDVHWSIHQRQVKTTGSYLAADLQEEHVCKAEGWCLNPLMLGDSEPKEECYHSLNWVMAGKANKMKWGAVKWASSPCVGVKGQRSTTSMWNAPTYQEVPTPILEGWLYYPSKQASRNDRAWGHAL